MLKQNNQKGFAAFELVLIIVALIAVGAAGYFAYQARQTVTNQPDNKQNAAKKVVEFKEFKLAKIKVPSAELKNIVFKEERSGEKGDSILISYGDGASAAAYRQCIQRNKSNYISPTFEEAYASADYVSSVFVYPGTFSQAQQDTVQSSSALVRQLDGAYIANSNVAGDCFDDNNYQTELKRLNDIVLGAMKKAQKI